VNFAKIFALHFSEIVLLLVS